MSDRERRRTMPRRRPVPSGWRRFGAGLAILFACAVPLSGQAVALYLDGLAAHRDGNTAGSVERYQAALAVNPSYLEPTVGLAEVFLETGEYREALRYAERARELSGDIRLEILEGRIRVGIGDLDGARQLFDAALQEEPNNLEARYALAELNIASGRTSEATAQFEEALRVAPTSRRALLALSLIHRDLGDPEVADRYLELALRYHAEDPEVHLQAGLSVLADGNPFIAVQHLTTALALRPEHLATRRALSRAFILSGDPDRAIEISGEIVADDPTDALAWYVLGVARERTADPAGAIGAFRRALSARPDDEVARLAMERLAMADLDLDDPVRVELARHHLRRGETAESRNFIDAARTEYRRAVRLAPVGRDPRLAYARLFRFDGLPVRYLRELQVLASLGYEDVEITDEIDSYASAAEDSLAAVWRVGDQYDLLRPARAVSLAYLAPDRHSMHPFASSELATYLSDLLLSVDHLETTPVEPVGTFEQSFRIARERRADYFILTRFDEQERSVSVEAALYLTATGTELRRFSVYRTGNDRVRNAVSWLAAEIAGSVPRQFTLVDREFERGLLDAGSVDGIAIGDELAVIRAGGIELSRDALAVTIDERDRLGTLTVDAVDERVASGPIVRASVFDFINPGDAVVRLESVPPPASTQPPPEPRTGVRGLVERLLGLSGPTN